MRLPALLLIAAALATPADAQVGSTTDIVMGRVIGPEGNPLGGAQVAVTSVESGITRTKQTNEKGQYSILFPDGGGNYQLRVTYIGMAPVQTTIQRQADEDRLVANITMRRAEAQALAPVIVRGQQRPPQFPRPEAGQTERNLPSGMTSRLPIDAGNLNDLATLAAGVTGVPATDSTPAGFSVAGQPSNQNNITLDGLSFGSGSVPQEALRNTRVITSTYDVGRGQFTGGQIASTTRGGTNTRQGVLNYSFRDPSLEFAEDAESFAGKYRQNQLSGGFGGPIKKDRMFAFGAFSLSRRTDDLLSLIGADSVTLERLGTNPQLVDRFLDQMRSYGIQPTLPGIPRDRLLDHGSALLRFDYTLNDRHTLMARGDWRWNSEEASRIQPLAVPHTGGEGSSLGGGGMVTLTSQLGSFINELRAYQSLNRFATDPYLTIPDGRVIVTDTLADLSRSITTLQFGGNPSLPQITRTTLAELADEVSWVSGDGEHRVKLGGLFNEERSTIGVIPNRFGTFTFQSLEDFEAGRPSQFTRTLSASNRKSTSQNSALYVGDAWRTGPKLQLTYGLRLEASRYPDAPAFNPLVEEVFGRRTDRFPSEVNLSPRAGFTLFLGAADPPMMGASRQERQQMRAARQGRNRDPNEFRIPLYTIRGGIGEFRGRAPSQLFGLAREATGLPSGQQQLVCVGTSVPSPDWQSYIDDRSTIPTECAGPPAPTRTARPNVTLFDEEFEAPKVWRGSLGVSRRFFDQRLGVSLDASFARGVSVTNSRDLNLVATPSFTIGSEGNRPVFAAPASIDTASGITSLLASRVDQRFGFVNEFASGLRSDTRQLTANINGIVFRRNIQVNASYTLTRSRDEARGSGMGFGGASTAGDPRRAEWGRSDQERKHTIVGTVMYPIKPWIDVTAISRLSSGSPFTPMVGGDVNGDGARNDRAFIFDPSAAGDTALSNGMRRVLGNSPERVRECLGSQLGQIAARNSCASPWSTSLDLQVNLRPNRWGLNHRLTLSVLALNALAGLDQLLHSSNDLRGWGQPSFPDRTLLYVRGFDPTTQRFEYQVNERFGAARPNRNAFRSPFQVALQVRLALGSDPAREQMRMVMRGATGEAQTPAQIKERMRRTIPNPFVRTLELEDSLKLALTPEQKTAIKTRGDSLQIKGDTVIGAIAEILGNAGKNPEPMTIMGKMQSHMQLARRMATLATTELQQILTAEQWAKLPEDVKNPFVAGQRRMMQGAPGEGPVRIEIHRPPEE